MSFYAYAYNEEIKISSSFPGDIKQYETVTFSFNLPYLSGNVNDFTKKKVEAVITTPENRTIRVPAFCISNKKMGNTSKWEVRYTPSYKGLYRIYIEAKSTGYKSKSKFVFFDVLLPNDKCFLRKSKNNNNYLTFDSGKPFFGIGHNVAWVQNNSIKVFERYFTEMKEAGCNLTRVWICDWSFPLEWKRLGEYNRDAANKLDELLHLARKKNIYIILCLDTYGSFMFEEGPWGENKWGINPYNKTNGGPCEVPEDFFTSKEARKWYKNKLRYIIARWGYSPNIVAFEFWNEYDAPVKWVKEMSGFLKSINPHDQLITTSIGYPWDKGMDENSLWKLKNIDLVTEHIYGSMTQNGGVDPLIKKSKSIANKYDKPFIIAEFGIDAAKDDKVYDPRGRGTALHNSIWASSLSGSFGTAMNWWWDSYIRPKKLYNHYKALSRFLEGVDWNSKKIEFPKHSPVMKKEKNISPRYRNVTIKTEDKWCRVDDNEYTILNDGTIEDFCTPNKYLHGESKRDIRKKHIFKVDYPESGNFIVRVGTVSQGAVLNIFLDGRKILSEDLTTGPGKGPWKRSMYQKKWDIYQCVYNSDFEIKVPKGKHTVELYNSGEDWLSVEKITLENYVDNAYANVRCIGLRIGDEILFWIQNKEFNWINTFEGVKPGIIKNVYFEVYDIEEGNYKLEWWNTFTGNIIFEEEKKIVETLVINIPEFSKDIACKIRKEE